MVINKTIGSSTDYGENTLKDLRILESPKCISRPGRNFSRRVVDDDSRLVCLDKQNNPSSPLTAHLADDSAVLYWEISLLARRFIQQSTCLVLFPSRCISSPKFADGFSSPILDTYLFPRLTFESPFADDTFARNKSSNEIPTELSS